MTLDLRTRAKDHDRLLVSRLDALIPSLMDRAGLDAWVLAAREYNEDPVLQTMLPATWLDTARRRTILLFLRSPDGVRRMAVARYAVGDAFPSAWDPEAQPDQWSRLAELLADADPARIGVNSSAVFPLADGLSASERAELVDHLPPALASRIVSAEAAAIGWLETRLPEERALLADACRQSHGYLRRALSAEVITPGTTTTADVEWWLRDAVHADGHGSWFHPTCTVQRRGGSARDSFAGKEAETVIEAGDLVHVDFGIVADGYHTDQQQHAYVLGPGETRAPDGLVDGDGPRKPAPGPAAGAVRGGPDRQRDPARRARGRRGRGAGRAHLHAPDRPPRPRRRSDHRPVGQPGRRRRARATTRSGRPRRTRSSCRPGSPSRSGTARSSSSCSRRTPGSTTPAARSSTAARRSSG